MSLITKNQIIKAAKNNCWHIEQRVDKYRDERVGIKIKHVFHWFVIINETALFDHSYSMNTGRSSQKYPFRIWNLILKNN